MHVREDLLPALSPWEKTDIVSPFRVILFEGALDDLADILLLLPRVKREIAGFIRHATQTRGNHRLELVGKVPDQPGP